MWRCSKCHSTAVEGLGWIELNSNISTGDMSADDSDDYWCEACETHTTVYFKDEPNEEYLTDDEENEDAWFPDVDVPTMQDDLPGGTEAVPSS